MPLKVKPQLMGMATVKRYVARGEVFSGMTVPVDAYMEEAPEGQYVSLEDFHLVVDQRDAAVGNLEKISRWTQTLVHEIRKVL